MSEYFALVEGYKGEWNESKKAYEFRASIVREVATNKAYLVSEKKK